MTKFFMASVLPFLFAGIVHASEQPPTDYTYGEKSDQDACGAVLCLLGMTRDGDCDKYVNQYFGIVKYKKGKFSPSRTASARGDFVAQCAEDQKGAGEANDKWGRIFRGF